MYKNANMAMLNSIVALCFIVSSFSASEAFDFMDNTMKKVDTSALNNGIPDVFPCKGPSRYSLEEANTKMLCGGRLCLVQCKTGYKSFTKIPFVYVCHSDGLWTAIPFSKAVEGYSINWPICFYNVGF